MEDEEILSNDEKDELLKNASTVDDTATAINADLELVDFSAAENTVAGYSGLRSINAIFVLDLTKSFSNFVNIRCNLKANDIRILTFSQLLKQEKEHTLYNCLFLKSQNCFSLINIEHKLMHHCLTVLYGGKIQKEETLSDSVGYVNLAMAKRITKLVMDSLIPPWKEICTLDYEIVNTTQNSCMLTKIALEESLVVTECEIEFNGITGNVLIALPKSMIDKVKPALLVNTQNSPDESENQLWKNSFTDAVYHSSVTLSASFPKIQFRLSDLMNLKDGDVIPIGNPEIVDIFCQGVKLYKAASGSANGASRVVKILEKCHNLK